MTSIARTLSFLLILGLHGVYAEGHPPTPPKKNWSFKGLTGTFNRAELQRGFQVYKQVCATCHGLNLLAYRNLKDLGYNESQIKAIAAEHQVKDGPDDEGEMFDRPALPSDKFVNPFPNAKAARAANNGALPPDLSLITKARVGGVDYLYAILTGYKEPPKDFHVMDGLHYNEYFTGHQIAMPTPLHEGIVQYEDGTVATVDQMAHDVSVFLSWAAEPEMEARKKMGLKVIIFLGVFCVLMYLTMVRVWKRLDE